VTTCDPQEILAALTAAVGGGRSVVLATIVATKGSSPRHAGAKMVVFDDGTTIGTVGGGEVEARVRDEALGMLGKRRPRLIRYALNDPQLGDPGVCGGTMSIYLESYMRPPSVYVFGAGHVGRSVVELAAWLGYRTIVVDDRPELVAEDAVPSADVRFPGTAEDALAHHPPSVGDAVVVVTRSHELDERIVPALLETDASYVGVMGSKRRWATTRATLVERGFDAAKLDRVHVPIGLDISAETVEEIAVSILSEIIASSAGASP
jgi:xanthine dehydrogenase accessory factor